MTYVHLTATISVIFLLFVTPMWLTLHYRAKGRREAWLLPEQAQEVEDLKEGLGAMEERVKALEELLNKEAPDWRDY